MLNKESNGKVLGKNLKSNQENTGDVWKNTAKVLETQSESIRKVPGKYWISIGKVMGKDRERKIKQHETTGKVIEN